MASPVAKDARPRAVTVTALVNRIRVGLSESFSRTFWMEGEISGLRPAAKGHLYFSLKDSGSQVDAVVWAGRAARLQTQPANGMAARVRVTKVDFYPPTGRLSVQLDALEALGAGALARLREENRRRFAAEGLFDDSRKRRLPFLPRTIGVVTARTGAVIHDILRIVDGRFSQRRILLRPVRVQGNGAGAEIADAIDDLNREASAEVLIVGRGGGSAEDLRAFDEEVVVRAIARSRIPVVSAVGHESDWTLADLVADQRAPTPSAAAQMVVPVAAELSAQLGSLGGRLENALRAGITNQRLRMRRAETVLGKPERIVTQRRTALATLARRAAIALRGCTPARRERLDWLRGGLAASAPRPQVQAQILDEAAVRMRVRMRQRLAEAGQDLAARGRALQALSPLAVLDRGYSLTRRSDDDSIVRDATELGVDDELEIRFARGVARARVLGLRTEEEEK
ncbi:MAG: exodeoxyribonuclease VII large subunit [Deltaproteobacteria bacterium]